MNIGDKVRHLQGTEEGIVIKFLGKGQVEVEIEDGFRIPFMESQLVVVVANEASFFGERPAQEKQGKGKGFTPAPKQEVYAAKGLYLAFRHRNDQQLEVYMLNNTDMDVLFSIGEEKDRNYRGISCGHVRKRGTQKVHEMNLDSFERWPALVVQAVRFKQGYATLQEPLVKKLRFRASSFHKHLQEETLLIGGKGYVFQLDEQVQEVDVAKLKNALEEQQGRTLQSFEELGRISGKARAEAKREVDLHIENLSPRHAQLSRGEALSMQMAHFETALDQAIVAGLDEVVFIHGVGNGVLRGQIHAELSKHPHVKHFSDARKEKFGYGATVATIR